MSTSLSQSAARGALFTLTATAIKMTLQIASVIVLSRLLTPHDYGLIAIVLVVIGVGEIFRDFGLTSAAVQAPSLSDGQRDNLFWINTAIGGILAVLMFGLSWPLAALTGEPALLAIVQILSVTFVFNGLTTQYRAQLMRGLKFRAMAFIDITAATLALATAIGVALLGAGYWALVVQQLVNLFTMFVGAVIAGRWFPRFYSRQHDISTMIRFGWNIVGTGILTYLGNQIDTIMVAARLGTSPLGLYNRAFQLVMTPLSQVRSPLSNVAIPVLSRVQEDQGRFGKFITSGQVALGYSLGIPLMLVAGLAEPVTGIMLGAQWSEAVPIMRLLAITGTLTTLSFVGYWVYISRGLGKQLFQYSIVSLTIRVCCVVTGSFFGLVGVAAGVAIAPAIAWPISLLWLSKVTVIPVRALITGALRIIVAVGLVGVASWGTTTLFDTQGWASLLTGGLVGLLPLAPLLSIPAYRRDARDLIGFATSMFKRDRTPRAPQRGETS